MKHERLLEYDMAKVILILLVLYGHSITQETFSPVWGGMHYDAMLRQAGLGDSLVHYWAVHIGLFVYQFHMAAFMALSGALYCANERTKGFREFLKSKSIRLLVPFFIITLLYAVPLKYVSGYFDLVPHVWKAIVKGQVFLYGNNYLWFLIALWEISIVFKLLDRFIKNDYLKLLILFLLHMSRGVIGRPFYYTGLEDSLWFISGYFIHKNRHSINAFIADHRWSVCMSWVLLIILRCLVVNLFNGRTPEFFYYLAAYTGMYAVYSLAYILIHAFPRILSRTLPGNIVSHNMGLYIYSDPLNYVIEWGAVGLLGIHGLSRNVTSLLILIVRFLGTLLIPIGISKVLRRTPLKFLT